VSGFPAAPSTPAERRRSTVLFLQPLPGRCAHAQAKRPIDCWMGRQICNHDVLIERCEVCPPVLSSVEQVPPLVWISTAGNVFHGTSTCGALAAGQEKRREAGYRARAALTVAIADAAGLKRWPCVACLEGVAWPPEFQSRRTEQATEGPA
jgi:hypothetical protein